MFSIKRTVLLFATTIIAAPIARADSLSFAGTFQADNDEAVFNFTTTGQGIFSVQTFSYGGGTDYSGNVVAAGGFAPAISIFDSTGMLVALDYTAGTVGSPDPYAACQGRAIDPSTNACQDAAVYGSTASHLNAGTYTLVLTQSGNQAIGANLSDGFTYDSANCPYSDGCSAYTGENSGLPGEMFVDPTDHMTQRSSNYDISFTGADLTSASEQTSISPVPEPGTFALVLPAALGVAGIALRRSRSSGSAIGTAAGQ